ncbi:hypothetical protein E5676_scaffold648G001770 [Cucumis melo var. makuwa]|uniref:Transposase-associated domain-containing protein n=1 Tax=Cucumis melo var. makuwa TaxID=1194695 RepID=A0A5D3CA19_CUCMM|nr:hypothetical protein E6C27_scaffold115G002240 [Cucumis melo var. makuwa]TYK08365.1 hypothetical protein E5676_scaffold648G001770 [Cucumis melo var. makuwa]
MNRDGVAQFIEVAKCYVNDVGKTRCPCKYCQNSMTQTLNGVERHLFTYGISSSYDKWVNYGEAMNFAQFEHGATSLECGRLSGESNVSDEDDDILDLLTDLQGSRIEREENFDDGDGFDNEFPEDVNEMDTSNIF